ncbi:MAG: PEP-CTERM sorting domain-containing protein [Akkermansia sp.]|nr:PEP-CTERM sorting domain-containing protein [Akkermansia sp.]
MDSDITFNLDKVTNVDGLELALAVAESTGKTVEEVFGTTSFTTKEYNSGNNNITLGGNVPEPTTATLSLLALAALAGRRRRK